jgi:hypothetical protein
MSFFPCPSCERHVKEGDAACPFCGASVAKAAAPVRVASRLSRSALFALSAAGALSVTDCGGTTSEPVYGAPVPAVDAGGDAPQDGSVQALYGAPAVDAAGQLQDASGVAIYGAAPPPPGKGG